MTTEWGTETMTRVRAKWWMVAGCLTGLLAITPVAFADTPISKCWERLCAEPQLSLSVVQYDLSTRRLSAGLLPIGSVGYGIRDVDDYIAAGVFMSASVGGASPGYMAPAVILRIMRAFSIGTQIKVSESGTSLAFLVGGGLGL